MALVKCRECGNEVSSKAQACPKCGASRPKRTSPAVIALGVLFGLGAIGSIIRSPQEGQSQTAAQAQQPTSPLSETSQQANLTPEPAWEYSAEQDKMGKGEISTATVNSSNTISFEFPYNGPQKATLHIRKHPRYGKDVILSITKGQFLCSSVSDGCSVSVRFDDRKAERFSASEPSDNDSTAVFIKGYDRFVSALKKSKTVRIEATFFHEGNRVMEFNTEGFKPI